MKTEQLRQAFLDYFKEQGHVIVPSSSLVPFNDTSLLFTNAGMVQFKDAFLGLDVRPYTRAASSQRCVRAGGKHNDLENVGYTARHHTFFEMLGNFSFGDYFKREAIQFAWDFLTKVLKLPVECLWITVFEEDKEAEDIWLKEVKIDPTRFSRCGAADNFWSMGETGPCGPCTEIYYDHGASIMGGPPGSADEGDRYIEIWNLVFMQFNRLEDGTLTPLPKPSVDTGMGLERVAAVMQGVHSNYEIDIFKALITAIMKLGFIKNTQSQSLRVIADHIRSCAFLVVDGVRPSNEGRGYVLRRIIRRAIRHGFRVGFTDPFFFRLVKPLVDEMGNAYPELIQKQAEIERVLNQEELQFAKTLEQGLKILEQDLATASNAEIPGETIFRLYDTYGFPVDLTADIARERQLTLDMAGFNAAMEQQKNRARGASQFNVQYTEEIKTTEKTHFVGYEALVEQSTVVALYQEGKVVTTLKAGEIGSIVLNHSPFYAEAGGQVGDQGTLEWENGLFEVKTTRKVSNAYFHDGLVKKGFLTIDFPVNALVNSETRKATALNHSATHLLHAALRTLLGSHVTQKGSLVEPARLRFDFSHFEAIDKKILQQVEHLVNEKIRENSEVCTEVLSVDEALSKGAMALFGEKYGEKVRVLQMGAGFSVELCGGTHVARTGDIGFFKITNEYGISAGIRRIEAVTGLSANAWVDTLENQLLRLCDNLKSPLDSIEDKLLQLVDKNKQLERENQRLKNTLVSGGRLNLQSREIHGIQVVAAKLPVGDVKMLREKVDQLKLQWKSAVIILAAVDESQKVILIAGISPGCPATLRANDLVLHVAAQVGGQGGGRADMAQGGGSEPEHLEAALESVYNWVDAQVSTTGWKDQKNV
jgi:alanyl-tRNA synthetase